MVAAGGNVPRRSRGGRVLTRALYVKETSLVVAAVAACCAV